MLNPEFKMVGILSCPHGKNTDRIMTVIDYAGTYALNENARQGVMASQEFNATIAKAKAKTGGFNAGDASAGAPGSWLMAKERCSELPETVVTSQDCAHFNLMNDIRENP